MYRICLVLFFVVVSPVFIGCGVFDFLRGDSDEHTKTATVKRDQIQEEVDRLRAENTDLKKRIDLLKNESKSSMDETIREMAKVEDEQKTLNQELAKLREENKRITTENASFKEKLEELQKKALLDLKIKVLSGDGDLRSAKSMTKKLMGMDYEIRLIGYAPRSNFEKNTVYFKPDFEKEGKRLVSRLGANTLIKPLTWSSIFDLIIVTGKNP